MQPESFPNLRPENHKVTSPSSWRYNCIAWSLGDDANWWTSEPGYYWPPRVPKPIHVLANVIKLYERLGFAVCDTPAVEVGFDRIAWYVAAGQFAHVARQLADGRWTSKLGEHEDIEHDSLEVLLGGEYEAVACVLKRRRK